VWLYYKYVRCSSIHHPTSKRRRLYDIVHFSVNVKGKVHPRTDHEASEGEQIYSSDLPSTSTLNEGWVVNATLQPLYPRETPGTHYIGSWVGLTACLGGCGKSRPPPTRIPSPDRPARSESLYRQGTPGPTLFGTRSIPLPGPTVLAKVGYVFGKDGANQKGR